MRLLPLFSLLFFAVSATSLRADSVDPDWHRLIREAQKPKVYYGPARAGWNGPETRLAQAVPNPVYESLRSDSPSAVRDELASMLLAQWPVLIALFGLILGLRTLRASREAAETEAGAAPNVVPFPADISGRKAA